MAYICNDPNTYGYHITLWALLCPITSGLSAGREAFFCFWPLTNVPTPICLCKPFSCTACPGKKIYRGRKASVHWLATRKRRALVVPRINRGSTAGFVPPSVYTKFRLFVLPNWPSAHVFSMVWRARRIEPSVFRSAPPCPALAPRRAPTRPWYVRV